MTAGSDNAEARASLEATDWLILLQDDPGDPDLRRRFDAWLAADPLNHPAWAATRHTADLLAVLDPISARRRSAPAPARRFGLALAASLALAAYLAAPSVWIRLKADQVTSAGETRTVGLPDGSSVVLAPSSAIAVSYAGGQRRIDLLKGEAFFIVQHNPAQPFRVDAGGVETTDIGTAFDIRRGGGETTVAVEDGSVRVDRGPAVSEVLTAGQGVRLASDGGAVRTAAPAGQVAAWRRNQLIAQDQTVREVVDRLRPFFRGSIVLTDGALAERPITGVYNLADPADALRGIAGAHGASVRRITPWILLISAS